MRRVLPLGDRNPTSRTAAVTLAVIAVNVVIYFFLQPTPMQDNSFERVQFTYRNAVIPEEVTSSDPLTARELADEISPQGAIALCNTRDGSRECFPDKQVWLSVLVSMFLHGSIAHLLGNMWFLWIFGNNVEDRLGHAGYVLFYGVAGVVATLAFVAVSPSSTTPLVGASGAIAGVMGAYLVWWPRASVISLIGFIPLPIPAWLWLGFWFVLQFFTDPASGVAWVAHVGGFVFGAIVGLVIGRPRPSPAYSGIDFYDQRG